MAKFQEPPYSGLVHQECWVLQGTLAGRRRQRGWSRWRRMVSGIGAIDDGKVPPPIPETIGKVSELVAHKYHSRHTVFVTTANENPNFQPISFLQSGTQIGRAVCRIVREFSLKDFKEFIKDIQESDDISHFDSVNKLREIFAIPQDISDRLLIPTTFKPYQDSLSKKHQTLIEGQSNPEVDVDQKERIKKQLGETDILKQLVDILQRKLEKQDISIDDINAVNKLNQHLFVLLGDLHPSLSTEAKATQAQRLAIELFKAVFIEKFYLSLNEQILALLNPIPLGTGFLVGETYLITNNHVLPDVKTAAQSIAQFNYVEDAAQNTQGTIDINLAPQKFFITNPELDYTLVQLHWDVQERQAGYQFGWIPLVEKDDHATPGLIWVYAQDSETLNFGQPGTQNGETINSTQQHLEILAIIKQHLGTEWALEPGCHLLGKRAIAIQYPRGKTQLAIAGDPQLHQLQQDLKAKGYQMVSLPGDPVFIVQHPKGRQKEIVLRDNEIINNGLFETVLRYQANSDYGSSGSPVFNENWELVALHHAAIAAEDTGQVSFQQGIRIHQIIADLKQQRFSNPQLATFLKNYVVTAEQLAYPPLPSGLEFDGLNTYVNAVVGTEPGTSGTTESSTYLLVTVSQDGMIKLWSQTGLNLLSQRIPHSPLLAATFQEATSRSALNVGIGDKGLFGEVHPWQGNLQILQNLEAFNDLSVTNITRFSILRNLDDLLLFVVVSVDRQDTTQSTTTLTCKARYSVAKTPGLKEDPREIRSSSQTIFKKTNLEITTLCATPTPGSGYNAQQYVDSANSGRILAVADAQGAIELYLFRENSAQPPYTPFESLPFAKLQGHRTAVRSLCFSEKGQYLFSGDESGRIVGWMQGTTYRNWSAPYSQDLHTLYPVTVTSLAFKSPFPGPSSQQFVVSGHADGVLKLWQFSTDDAAPPWVEIATFDTHQGAIASLSFNPDQTLLVSASDDGKANLWQWSDRNPTKLALVTSLEHGGSLVQALFNPAFQPSPVPDEFSLVGKPFTIEAWVNPHPNGSGGTLISRLQREQGKASGEYVLYLTKEGHVAFSLLPGRSNHPKMELQTRSPLRFGSFSHVAVVCSQVDDAPAGALEQVCKVYINGQESGRIAYDTRKDNETTQKGTEPPPQNIETPQQKTRSNSNNYQPPPLLFGAFLGTDAVLETTSSNSANPASSKNSMRPTGFFRGVLAEVRIWKTARSLEAIQKTMYRRLLPTEKENADLVGYWRLEEGQGNRAYNQVASLSSGRSYGLTAGGQWVSAYSPALPLPFGLRFDGMDNVVTIQQIQTSNQVTTALTVEAWIQHRGGDGVIVHSCGGWHPYAASQEGGGVWEKGGFSLACYQRRLRLALQPCGKNGPDHQLKKRATFDAQNYFPQDGLWHHIAFTLQPAKGNQEDKTPDEQDNAFTVELYLDGKRQNIVPIQGLSSSLLVGGQYRSRGTFSGFMESPAQSLAIGGPSPNSAQAPWNLYFNGAIAEVRLWHRVKTQSEIRSAMNYRLRGNETGLIGYWRLDTLIQVNGQLHLHNAAIAANGTLPESHGLTSSEQGQSQPGFFPISTDFPVDTVGHWAADFVQEMVDKRLMEEFWSRDRITSDRFQPNQPVLAAEFSRIVNNTFGIDLRVAGRPFTRVQAICHLVQGLQLKADAVTVAGVNQFLRGIYKEADQIREADRMGVAIATANRLIVNAPPPKTAQETTTNTQPEISPQLSSLTALRPTDNLTRAELAALVSRALVAVGQARETQPLSVVEPHWAAAFVANLKHYVNQDPTKQDPAFNDFKFDDPVRPKDYRDLFKAAFKQESNARFNEQKALTRLEAIAALVKDLHLKPRYLNLSKVYESDEAMADPAYLDALRTATAQKMVVNYPNVKELRSQATLTKAELGALIYQVLVAKRASGVIPINSPYIVIPPNDAALERFSDVPPNHWAADFIHATANLGFDGPTQTTFQPNAPVSAKDYAFVTAQCLASLSPTQEEDREISAAVLTAYELESILADFGEIGHPDRPVKRQEAIYHLVKHLQLSAAPFSLATVYQDGDQVTRGELQEAIATATTNELLVNYPDARRLNPTRAITRAELSALLYQSLVAIGQMPKIASPYLATALGFTDIEGHWAREKILYLVGRNIVKGFPDGTFRPSVSLLRAEFAALLVKAFNPTVPDGANSTSFSDVPSNFWARNAIQQASASSLMIGLPDNQFGPELPVTRLQAAIVLVNCLIKQEKAPPIDPATLKLVTDNYTDIQTLNPATKRLMIQQGLAIAVQVGIIARPTPRSQFRPDAAATRAEVVGMVAAALQSPELSVG